MNITVIDQAVAELKQDRERIDRAIEGLNVIADFYNRRSAGRASPSVPPPSDRAVGRHLSRKAAAVRKGSPAKVASRRKAAAEDPSCEKHPDCREFTPKGKCRICIRDYMRHWYKKNAKGKAAKVQSPPAARKLAAPVPAAPASIVMLRCPSCPERFPNARELGVHQSREHYSSSSSMGSSLGQV